MFPISLGPKEASCSSLPPCARGPHRASPAPLSLSLPPPLSFTLYPRPASSLPHRSLSDPHPDSAVHFGPHGVRLLAGSLSLEAQLGGAL